MRKKRQKPFAELKTDQRVLIALGINPKRTFIEPFPNARPPAKGVFRLDRMPKHYRLKDGDVIHIGV